MSVKRKVQLTLLFSLSLGVVGTTAYRVPHILWQDGSQQIRSLLASVELLFATGAANALVLGSFVRDRGVKKAKFRYGSITGESITGESESMSRRRPTLRHWGSDEDLIRSLGLRAERALRREYNRDWDDTPQYTPAPLARIPDGMRNWQFPKRRRSVTTETSDEFLLTAGEGLSRSTTETTPRKVSFFDVGGLLDDEQHQQHGTQWRESFNSSIDPLSPVSPYSALSPHSMPTPSVPAASSGMRRGSQALLQDIGGLLTPQYSPPQRPSPEVSPRTTELQSISHLRRGPAYAQDYRNQPELRDPGGLLSR